MEGRQPRINPKEWRKQKGPVREVYRQLEWFRSAVDHYCAETGEALRLAQGIDKSPAFICLLRSGKRLGDFSTTVRVAWHFRRTLEDFLADGRELAEGSAGKHPDDTVEARRLLDRIMRSGEPQTRAMVLGMLQAAHQHSGVDGLQAA